MSEPTSPECRTVLGRISTYLDGELGPNECESIERHCAQCARCAELVAGLRETVGLCHEAGGAALPEPVRQRARASIQRLLDDATSGKGQPEG